MGSEFLTFQQDPWAGNFATSLMKSLQAAPGHALDNEHKVETILSAREERARNKAKWDAAQEAASTGVAAVPEASVPPSYRPIEQQGPVNPADPTTQPGETFLPPSAIHEPYTDPRLLAAAQARAAAAKAGIRATLLNDPSKWALQQAHGEVAAAGMPTDPRRRAEQTFQTTGKYPTSDETKLQGSQNYSILDANNQVVGSFATRNGQTTLEGRLISSLYNPNKGERVLETGHAPLESNPLKDKGAARERLAVLSRSIGPSGPTPEQAAQIEQLVGVGYPPERVVEKVGDRETVRHVQKEPIPDWVKTMMQPRAAAAPGAAPAAAVDPNADREVEVRPGSAIELRKEYANLPEIKRYANTAVTWNSVIQSAYTGNKAGDLDIVYGFIKMMDDLTGVREGETKMVGQVGSWSEQINSLKGQATGEGLDPQTRVNIIQTMQRHMGEIKAAALEKEKFYAQTATDSGLAPKAVLPPLMPMQPFDEARALAVRNRGATSASGPRGARAPAAPPPATAPPPVIQRGDAVFGGP